MTAIIVWIKRNWKLPVLSLALTMLSYAVLSPSLSFYLDDWPQLYSLEIRGIEGIKQYFLLDGRPYGFWPDLMVYRLWGTNPLGWHFTNYALRWLTGIFMWGTFVNLWPQRKREIGWAVLLFAVFPSFVQQSMGTTFIAHWFCYALFFLSLFLTGLAVRHKRSAVWLIAAVLPGQYSKPIHLRKFYRCRICSTSHSVVCPERRKKYQETIRPRSDLLVTIPHPRWDLHLLASFS